VASSGGGPRIGAAERTQLAQLLPAHIARFAHQRSPGRFVCPIHTGHWKHVPGAGATKSHRLESDTFTVRAGTARDGSPSASWKCYNADCPSQALQIGADGRTRRAQYDIFDFERFRPGQESGRSMAQIYVDILETHGLPIPEAFTQIANAPDPYVALRGAMSALYEEAVATLWDPASTNPTVLRLRDFLAELGVRVGVNDAGELAVEGTTLDLVPGYLPPETDVDSLLTPAQAAAVQLAGGAGALAGTVVWARLASLTVNPKIEELLGTDAAEPWNVTAPPISLGLPVKTRGGPLGDLSLPTSGDMTAPRLITSSPFGLLALRAGGAARSMAWPTLTTATAKATRGLPEVLLVTPETPADRRSSHAGAIALLAAGHRVGIAPSSALTELAAPGRAAAFGEDAALSALDPFEWQMGRMGDFGQQGRVVLARQMLAPLLAACRDRVRSHDVVLQVGAALGGDLSLAVASLGPAAARAMAASPSTHTAVSLPVRVPSPSAAVGRAV
jgi:hypothetical protein